MSKSLGNSLFLKDLLDKYSPEVIKFALLGTNYRGDINVTDNLFPDAEKHLYEFYKIILAAETAYGKVDGENAEIDVAFNKAMDDDFNTALAISNLFGIFKAIKSKVNSGDSSAAADVSQVRKTYSLIGLFETDAKAFVEEFERKNKEDIPEEVVKIAEERLLARKEKNWAKSDELRDKITALGYTVKDGKDCYTLTKN
jgi:cysteinyl-tRNA synthetase